jgi:hypothetical protein
VKIAGLVAFYNEEVDLFVDNQPQQRPVTKFSRKERTTMPNETAPNENAHQTRLERILGVQLAEDAVRQWPRSGDGRVYRNISIAELHDGKAVRVTDYRGEPFTGASMEGGAGHTPGHAARRGLAGRRRPPR